MPLRLTYSTGTPPANLSWRETAAKIAIRMAGYVDPGPLRPPFVEVPAEVTERMKLRVERWHKVCAKYRAIAPAETAPAEAGA